MILTYREAAKKLNVTRDIFRRYIERIEFAPFRTFTLAKIRRRFGNSEINFERTCHGVCYCKEFIELFRKLRPMKEGV